MKRKIVIVLMSAVFVMPSLWADSPNGNDNAWNGRNERHQRQQQNGQENLDRRAEGRGQNMGLRKGKSREEMQVIMRIARALDMSPMELKKRVDTYYAKNKEPRGRKKGNIRKETIQDLSRYLGISQERVIERLEKLKNATRKRLENGLERASEKSDIHGERNKNRKEHRAGQPQLRQERMLNHKPQLKRIAQMLNVKPEALKKFIERERRTSVKKKEEKKAVHIEKKSQEEKK